MDFSNISVKEFIELTKGKEDLKLFDFISTLQVKKEVLNSDRWAIFESSDPEAYLSYKEQESAFWVPEEVTFSQDERNFGQLTEEQKIPLIKCLVVFQTLDGAVIDQFVLKLIAQTETITEKLPYVRQLTAEATHAESYKLQLEAIVRDSVEREKLIRSIDSEEWIQNYRNFISKYMDNPFEELINQLIVQAFLEGVGFSAFFAVIFWYKQMPFALDIPGITESNEFIIREEGMHRDYAILRINRLKTPDLEERLKKISDELISIIEKALPTILPVDLPQLTKKSLLDYCRYVSDGNFIDLGYPEYYNVDNPLTYMETIGSASKSNFFERGTTTYSHISKK